MGLYDGFDVKAVSGAVMLDSLWVSQKFTSHDDALGVARHQPKQIRRQSCIFSPHSKNT
jgi:hypothetical protein